MAGIHNGLDFSDDISKLGLPKVIETNLKKSNIVTIFDLCSIQDKDITKVKYIGDSAKLEIICALAHFDFKLGDTKYANQ